MPKVQITPTITETKPSVTQTPTEKLISPTKEAKSDWKTYQSKNGLYSFQYPADVTLKEDEEGQPGVSLTLFGPSQKMETEAYDGIYLRFYPPVKLEGKSLKDYVQEKVNKDKEQPDMITIVKDLEEITIGELKGYTYTISGLGIHKSIFLQSPYKTDDFIEIVDSSADPSNQGYLEIIDQILASFKFNQ